MRVLKYCKAIQQSAARLKQLRDKQKGALYYRRLHFLYLLKSGSCITQAAAGGQIGIKERGAQKLWHLYQSKGLQGLLEKSHAGRPSKLDEPAKEVLQKALDSDKLQSLQQACDLVKSEQGISISPSTLHYYFKAMGIKKKTARPTSVRKDEKGERVFKKKSFPH
jgi:transposase